MFPVKVINLVYRVIMYASAAILLLFGIALISLSILGSATWQYPLAGLILCVVAIIPFKQAHNVLRPNEPLLDIVTGEEFKTEGVAHAAEKRS